jgi:hypothetical protein
MTSGSNASLNARADPREWTRRRLLAALAAGGLGIGGAAVGSRMLTEPEDAETNSVDDEESRALAEQFAPEVYFDRYEKWFMTDPRPYTTEVEGDTVVDGFTALNDYTSAFEEGGDPPEPVVFYNAVQYEDSPLAVIQFWMYSVFDQFATNFHWHDWEVLHVFVDTETEEAQLYVASAHSRKIPNNEFLDPESSPAIITELGAHASGLGVNASPDRFQRFPTGDLGADITNQAIESIEELADFPLAYGLPRDESLTLAFAMPELDGQPLYDDDRLPDVTRDGFVSADLTVRSFADLASRPRRIRRPTPTSYTISNRRPNSNTSRTSPARCSASSSRFPTSRKTPSPATSPPPASRGTNRDTRTPRRTSRTRTTGGCWRTATMPSTTADPPPRSWVRLARRSRTPTPRTATA